ncbi:hypothetical protein DPMN_111817 [Dreissena polymorpha]|uniref:Uncharacterized protein n=1 Tax=Dreissena polymorpha TaxID=45954 RepID=A0A9D4QPF1_DREPO|nr:hypothetical protein DPMN_111817 [Dreissena polymorpha]
MQLADTSAVISGLVTNPVAMQLGKQTFTERVYVAPISDDMLLGHDLLHHLGAKIDLKADSLIVKGEKISLNTNFKEKQPVAARVTVSKRTVVPPNSVVRVECCINTPMNDNYVEPCQGLDVVVPRVVRAAGEKPLICFVNSSDNFQTLKRGKLIGIAHETFEIVDIPLNSGAIPQNSLATSNVESSNLTL